MMFKATIYLLTLLSTLTLLSVKSIAHAEESTAAQTKPDKIKFVEPDYNFDAPQGRDRGTGSRSICSASNLNSENIILNALVPAKTRGLTTKERPSLWINIKYPANFTSQTIMAQFSLEEVKSNTKVLKDLPITLPSSSSTLQLEIPYTLEQNKWYRWYLVVDCSALDKSEKNTVISTEGLIQRKQLLPQTSKEPEEIARVYAVEGIWYDALDQAAQLKCKNQHDLKASVIWLDLLTQVNLTNLAEQPLLCNKL